MTPEKSMHLIEAAEWTSGGNWTGNYGFD